MSLDLSLYFIAGSQDFADLERKEQNLADYDDSSIIKTIANKEQLLLSRLEQVLKVGISAFQFREKGKNSLINYDDRKKLAIECQKLCKKYSTKFFINDDLEMAMALSSDGVHLGQTDFDIGLAIEKINLKSTNLEKINSKLLIGYSVNTLEQAQDAFKIKGLDYLGVGSIFSTSSKQDAKEVGVSLLEKTYFARESKGIKIPLIGIGGINAQNAQKVWQAGADGIAIISALTKSQHLETTINQLRKPNHSFNP